MALSPLGGGGVWSTPEPASWQLAEDLRARISTKEPTKLEIPNLSAPPPPPSPASQVQNLQAALANLSNLISKGENASSALGDFAKGVAALTLQLNGGHVREATEDPRPNFMKDPSPPVKDHSTIGDPDFDLLKASDPPPGDPDFDLL